MNKIKKLSFLLKLPYYKLGSYAFMIFLLYYALSLFVNYLFMAYHGTSVGTQFEVFQYTGPFDSFLGGNFMAIFYQKGGDIVTVSNLIIFSNIFFSEGSWLFPNLINILLNLSIIYMLSSVLRRSSVSRYIFWIMMFWVIIMMFVPNNSSYTFLGVEHAMPLYMYFMVMIDLLLFIRFDKLKTYNIWKKSLYHGIFIICLIITSLTWSFGILIWPVIIFLMFLRGMYKPIILHMILLTCMIYFILLFLPLGIVVPNVHTSNGFIIFIRYFFSVMGAPSVYNIDYITNISSVLQYIRGTFVIGLVIWVIYMYQLHKIFNLKTYLKRKNIIYKPWELFFIGLLLYTLAILLMLIVLRYDEVRAKHGYIFDSRFYIHYSMFAISLFVLIATQFAQKSRSYIKVLFAGIVMVYVGLILIPNTKEGHSRLPDLLPMSTLRLAMKDQLHNVSLEGYRDYFKKFWNLNGHGIWQKQLMSEDVNYLTNHSKIKGRLQWFTKDKPCTSCILYLETRYYMKGKFNKDPNKYNTIYLVGLGYFPYKFSQTAFITDDKNIIVGLAGKSIEQYKFVNIFNVWHEMLHAKVRIQGYFYVKNIQKGQQYTLWALGLDRRHITPLYTFTFKSRHPKKIYIWR